MIITTDHLRQHGIENHTVECTKNFCDNFGIDFKDFVKNGIDHSELVEIAKTRKDVLEFLEFFGLT